MRINRYRIRANDDLSRGKMATEKKKKTTGHSCPNCLSPGMVEFHRLENVPVHSVLNISTREKALDFDTGDISLGFCDRCGFISNLNFDPDLLNYSSNCEESQGYSPVFSAYAERMAKDLIEKYDLRGKMIIEIGCGKGDFLSLLCHLGKNRGVGFDPAYVKGRDLEDSSDRVLFINDFYSEKYIEYQGDLIVCRMTLEHIKETKNFIGIVRRSIKEGQETVVFFQVPNVVRILRACSFEDIYYEHCSYFSPGSLARLFRQSGFDIINIKTEYADQYILIEAKPVNGDNPARASLEDDLENLKTYIRAFQSNYKTKLAYWKDRLQDYKTKNKRSVIWGAGSKGVAFLTTLKAYDEIEYAIDINPYRQNSYMAGTGQKIIAPGQLKEYRPDIVIVMNPVYLKEIEKNLQQMSLTPELLSL